MASIAESTDFTSNALSDMGQTVSLIPVTKTINNNGDEILTEGSSSEITAIINLKISRHTQEKMGLSEGVNGYIMVSPTTTITRDDIIEVNSRRYRIDGIVERGPSGDISLYKFAELYLLGDA